MRNNSSTRPTVVAVYCPVWHRYPHMDSWKGEGWNEWELLKTAPPRFKGHYQPLQPTWGCFDESDPKWAKKEIDLAADHGIDVFLFDWYWYSGVKLMEEALERGFLRAPNRHRLKFALLWANHHWADYFPAPYKGAWNSWLPMRHSPRDFGRVIDYCIEHYFRQPNYWRLNDKLFFSIFDIGRLIEGLGGAEKTRRVLRDVDRKLRRHDLPPIHWNGMTGLPSQAARWAAAGFVSTTTYNVVSDDKRHNNNGLIHQYEDVAKAHSKHWRAMSKTELPYLPIVTMGWDVTPRCRHEVPWPFKPIVPNSIFARPSAKRVQCYPYMHVVVGNTPNRFHQLCRDAAQHLTEVGCHHRVVLLNAWNEWTEGCYLLPEKRYGDGYLKAVRSAFGLAKNESESRTRLRARFEQRPDSRSDAAVIR